MTCEGQALLYSEVYLKRRPVCPSVQFVGWEVGNLKWCDGVSVLTLCCPLDASFLMLALGSLMWTDTAAIATLVVIALKWVVSHHVVLGIKPGPLEKHPGLLTTEQSLYPTLFLKSQQPVPPDR